MMNDRSPEAKFRHLSSALEMRDREYDRALVKAYLTIALLGFLLGFLARGWFS